MNNDCCSPISYGLSRHGSTRYNIQQDGKRNETLSVAGRRAHHRCYGFWRQPRLTPARGHQPGPDGSVRTQPSTGSDAYYPSAWRETCRLRYGGTLYASLDGGAVLRGSKAWSMEGHRQHRGRPLGLRTDQAGYGLRTHEGLLNMTAGERSRCSPLRSTTSLSNLSTILMTV